MGVSLSFFEFFFDIYILIAFVLFLNSPFLKKIKLCLNSISLLLFFSFNFLFSISLLFFPERKAGYFFWLCGCSFFFFFILFFCLFVSASFSSSLHPHLLGPPPPVVSLFMLHLLQYTPLSTTSGSFGLIFFFFPFIASH